MLTLFRCSLRQLTGGQRSLSFWLLLALLPALLGVLGWALAKEGVQGMSLEFFNNLTLALILPTLALLVFSSLWRREIQDQTIVYLYLKPLARTSLVLAPFAAGAALLLLLMALTVLSSAAVFQDGRVVVFMAVGAAAVLAYGAFFSVLSLFVSRTVLWGFGYLLLWEGFLVNLSRPASLLSIKKYLLSLEQTLLGNFSETPLGTALLVLLGVLALSLVIAIWRLWSMEFSGDIES